MRTVLLVGAFLALATAQIVYSDEVRDALDQAIGAYETDVAAIEAQVDQDLGELFDGFADKGDLDKAQKVEEIRERFATEGLLPDDPLLRTIREKARLRFSKANREMRTAYRAAISAYTRARKLQDAEEVKRSLQDFEKEHATERLQFPRADKKEASRPKRDNASDTKAATKPTIGPKPERGAVGNPKAPEHCEPSEELALLISKGREREVLADRLATRNEKIKAMDQAFDRISRGYKTHSLTYDDCVYLHAIPIECPGLLSETKINSDGSEARSDLAWWPSMKLGKLGQQVSVSRLSGSVEYRWPQLRYRFIAMWLLASPTPEDFIARTAFLTQTDEVSAVSEVLEDDDLKVWLGSLKCSTREEIAAVITQLQEADTPFDVVKKFAEKEGF